MNTLRGSSPGSRTIIIMVLYDSLVFTVEYRVLIEYILSPECLRDIKNRDKKPRRSRGFLSRFFINRVNTRAKYVFYLNRYNKNRSQVFYSFTGFLQLHRFFIQVCTANKKPLSLHGVDWTGGFYYYDLNVCTKNLGCASVFCLGFLYRVNTRDSVCIL